MRSICAGAPNCGRLVGAFDRNGARSQQVGRVLTIRQKCVPVLKKPHGPTVFPPTSYLLPNHSIAGSNQRHSVGLISIAWFDHSGKKDAVTISAAVGR